MARDGAESRLLTPPLERRRAERALRRALGTELLGPAQLALLERGAIQSPSTLRPLLASSRASQAEPLRALERAIPAPRPSEDAARPRLRPPAPSERTPKPWRGDAVAQAQTLREAARDGTPFCAICETARQAGSA